MSLNIHSISICNHKSCAGYLEDDKERTCPFQEFMNLEKKMGGPVGKTPCF